jgi:hypothetical protein
LFKNSRYNSSRREEASIVPIHQLLTKLRIMNAEE